jgi:hypothetical protein
MAQVEVAGDQLIVQIEGMDKLWTLKSRLDIPLAHVTDAEADPEAVRGWKGWRGPGANIPGVIWPAPSTTRATGFLGRARSRQGGGDPSGR